MFFDFIKSENALELQISDLYVEKHRLKTEDFWIKRTFRITESAVEIIETDEEYITEIKLKIGIAEGDYYKLDKSIFGIHNDIYFSRDFSFNEKDFILPYRSSFIQRLDHYLNRTVYIGGNERENDWIPQAIYKKLRKKFPTNGEISAYVGSRVDYLLREFIPDTNQLTFKHEQLLDRINKSALSAETQKFADDNAAIDLEQLKAVRNKLQYLLGHEPSMSELDWQRRIKDIFLILYPQYIYCKQSVKIQKKHYADFMLVDANGCVDLIEIKKPAVKVLSDHPTYRKNHIPSRELNGVTQQMENYLYLLNSWGNEGPERIKKQFGKAIPEDFEIQIINAKWIILMGRSNEFTDHQKRDFELIKRRFKNISDIMTYDDLIQRISNMIVALSRRAY